LADSDIELHRTLGSVSSFAAGFSHISTLTGMFQTSFLGIAFAGPALAWFRLVVLFGAVHRSRSSGSPVKATPSSLSRFEPVRSPAPMPVRRPARTLTFPPAFEKIAPV
jgi:hypothetical protein